MHNLHYFGRMVNEILYLIEFKFKNIFII